MSGFDLGGAINGTAEWACNAPIIRTVVNNPIFTALLITALVVIVIMALYHYQIKQAGAKKAVKAFLYVFLLVTAVMFVHHYAVMRSARDAASQKGVRDVFSSIEQSRLGGAAGATPVIPWGFPDAQPISEAEGGAPPMPVAVRGPRPDNIALDVDTIIEDVVVPATAGPFSVK
jgi:hypothetical protein